MPAVNDRPLAGRRGKVRFGIFEADLDAQELYRSGIRVRIQQQPFKVLALLLERPGEIVPREELQRRLWGNETTVDFDHSLGTAINKLREALGDSAENPRFVETLARRGYRFIAPVAPLDPLLAEPASTPSPLPPVATAAAASSPLPRKQQSTFAISVEPFRWLAACCLLALLLTGWGVWYLTQGSSHHPPAEVSQVTFSGRVPAGALQLESFPATAVDGSRIYYVRLEDGRAVLAQASVRTGQSVRLQVPSEIMAPVIGDISPDGTRLLVRNHLSTAVEQPLWIVPTMGDTAQKIPRIVAHDATWMPDGSHILFANGENLYVASGDGSGVRQFASVPGRAFWLRWSPDGRRLRFTVLDPLKHTTALWELDAAGQHAHAILPGWSQPASECCGSWTADGKYFVFQSQHGAFQNLWALTSQRSHTPVQITNGPLIYAAPVTARRGHRIFFIGSDEHSELLRLDRASDSLLPYNAGPSSAYRVQYSQDGKWLAWVDPHDGSLWRSRADGSEVLQLTAPPLSIFMMRWSPDDKTLAVMARNPGTPWKIYRVAAAGGVLQPLLPETRNEADPDWSPDGQSIVFGRLPNLMAEPSATKSVHVVNLRTHNMQTLPASQGLFSPRWSPDGHYIAATTLDQHQLLLLDLATQKWTVLTTHSVADPAWSNDGRSIYFQAFLEDGQPIYRVSVPDGKLEHITELNHLHSPDIIDYTFTGLTPEGDVLIRASMWTGNIYSLDLDDQFR
jgi:Tol biopolymer transport system component/DNA-binding winged helix-turn-helix (wHTH) protein